MDVHEKSINLYMCYYHKILRNFGIIFSFLWGGHYQPKGLNKTDKQATTKDVKIPAVFWKDELLKLLNLLKWLKWLTWQIFLKWLKGLKGLKWHKMQWWLKLLYWLIWLKWLIKSKLLRFPLLLKWLNLLYWLNCLKQM